MRKGLGFLVILAVTTLPCAVLDYGPHDNSCVDCHSIHDVKGAFSFAVAAPPGEKYPLTGQPLSGVDALCLGCHSAKEGIMPISLSKSHPLGIKPRKAFVPQEVLNKNGELACNSCHDPHPSNPNFKYLRVNTDGGKRMGAFCAYCHEGMVDKNELKKP